jgi:hypothetical protein
MLTVSPNAIVMVLGEEELKKTFLRGFVFIFIVDKICEFF